ncbi:hypothetical protein F5884DRAFT_820108 [Xylogone sp. PMI_703]|nr:hypothetical protein F5884DRAFT_820108 [Xylogone sp. PMI_703]
MENSQSVRKVYRRVGNNLRLSEEPIPTLGTSDVLIKVHAVSLNWKDAAILYAKYPWRVVENGIPCADASGEVVSVGEKVTRLKKGDRVVALHDLENITGRETIARGLGQQVEGTLASHLIFAELELVKFPDYLSWVEATILPCAGLTAWSALDMVSRIAGKTILIEGTGGVSLVALFFAVKLGAKTIVTSSSDDKLQRVKALGATHTINYKSNPEWEKDVLALTDGVGVDLVVEQGGASTFMQSVKTIRRGGRLSQVGLLTTESKGDFTTLVQLLIMKELRIVGIQVGTKRDLEELMDFLRISQLPLTPVIDRLFKFEDSEEAFKYLVSGSVFGKVVIEL